MEIKRCPKCKTEKSVSEYHKNKLRKDGMAAYCKACIREKNLAFNTIHREEIVQHAREYRKSERHKKWVKQNRDRTNERSRESKRRLRIAVLEHYGTVCACCEEQREVFLDIDHIEGGGTKWRREDGHSGNAFYRWLRKNDYPSGFRTLCRNCNWATHLLGKCPHQTEREEKGSCE